MLRNECSGSHNYLPMYFYFFVFATLAKFRLLDFAVHSENFGMFRNYTPSFIYVLLSTYYYLPVGTSVIVPPFILHAVAFHSRRALWQQCSYRVLFAFHWLAHIEHSPLVFERIETQLSTATSYTCTWLGCPCVDDCEREFVCWL